MPWALRLVSAARTLKGRASVVKVRLRLLYGPLWCCARYEHLPPVPLSDHACRNALALQQRRSTGSPLDIGRRCSAGDPFLLRGSGSILLRAARNSAEARARRTRHE
jgi:hypothetical protein